MKLTNSTSAPNKWNSIDDQSEQRKYAVTASPHPNPKREKMNKTALVRGGQNDLSNATLRRDVGNKSMKKLHKKEDITKPDEKDQNFHLLKDIPKYNKKKAKDNFNQGEFDNNNERLKTPISSNLENTFIIKNDNDRFDHYYAHMRRKKGDTFKNSAAFAGLFNHCLKPCDRPTARDGHTIGVYKDRLYVFGGDRHHMPYNDTFSIEL